MGKHEPHTRLLYCCSMQKLPCLAALIIATISLAQAPDPLKLVDPMIGTGPEGHTFPGATAPFGMVQLSPDTQIRYFKQSYKWAAGYRYEDTTILGFSHTHFSGAGHSDLGDFLITPISGDNESPYQAEAAKAVVRRTNETSGPNREFTNNANAAAIVV